MRSLELRVERIVHEQVGLQLVQLIDILLARQLFIKRLAVDLMFARVPHWLIVLQRDMFDQSSMLMQSIC